MEPVVKVSVEPPPVIVLPPQSPDKPVIADRSKLEAEEKVMSLKSALVKDVVALVIVMAVLMVVDLIRILLVAELPLILFPFIAILEDDVKRIVFAAIKFKLSPIVKTPLPDFVTFGINSPPVVSVAATLNANVDVESGV